MQQSGHREIDCKTCWNGYRNSRNIWWTQDQHPLEVTEKILQSHQTLRKAPPEPPDPLFLPTNHKRSTTYLHIFPRIQIARFARVRKLQVFLAGAIQKATYSAATKFGDIITADHQIFRRRMELETGANRQRSSTMLQAQQSRSPSSAGTTRGTNGSTTVGKQINDSVLKPQQF